MSTCQFMIDDRGGFYLANTDTKSTRKIEFAPSPYRADSPQLKNLGEGVDPAEAMCLKTTQGVTGGRKKTHRRHKKSHRRHKKSHRR